MDWTNISTGNSSNASQPPFTMEDFRKITEKFRTEERELLRGESLMIEQIQCPKCGRKPTITGKGIGDKTYVVCPHIWEALKRHVPPAQQTGMTPEGLPPIGWNLYGVRIEVMDDGPLRW